MMHSVSHNYAPATLSARTVHETGAAKEVLDAQAMDLLELFTYTQQKINDHLETVFAADNLSLAHYRALFFVQRYPGITVSGLIDKLNITKQSLARVLADLMRVKDFERDLSAEALAQADGYVYSVVDAADRRARRLYLTTKGSALMTDALTPVVEALKKSFGRTGPADPKVGMMWGDA